MKTKSKPESLILWCTEVMLLPVIQLDDDSDLNMNSSEIKMSEDLPCPQYYSYHLNVLYKLITDVILNKAMVFLYIEPGVFG